MLEYKINKDYICEYVYETEKYDIYTKTETNAYKIQFNVKEHIDFRWGICIQIYSRSIYESIDVPNDYINLTNNDITLDKDVRELLKHIYKGFLGL